MWPCSFVCVYVCYTYVYIWITHYYQGWYSWIQLSWLRSETSVTTALYVGFRDGNLGFILAWQVFYYHPNPFLISHTNLFLYCMWSHVHVAFRVISLLLQVPGDWTQVDRIAGKVLYPWAISSAQVRILLRRLCYVRHLDILRHSGPSETKK